MSKPDDTAQGETPQNAIDQDAALVRALARLPDPVVPGGLAARIVARATMTAQPEPVAEVSENAPAKVPAGVIAPRATRPPVPAQRSQRAYGRWSAMAASVAITLLVAGGLVLRDEGTRPDSTSADVAKIEPQDAPRLAVNPPTPAASDAEGAADQSPNALEAQRLARSEDAPSLTPSENIVAQKMLAEKMLAKGNPIRPVPVDTPRMASQPLPENLPPVVQSGSTSGAEKTVTAQAGPPAPGPDALAKSRGVYGPPAPSGFGITGGTGGINPGGAVSPGGGGGAPMGRSSTTGGMPPGSSIPGSAKPGALPPPPGSGQRP